MTASRTQSLDATDGCWGTAEPWIVPGLQPGTQPGSRFGRYQLGRELGRGAMGVVLEAYDARLDRRVAIKLLRHSTHGPAEDRRRLLGEARAMACLSHPCVVPVYDVGVHGLVAYVVMELVDAPTLEVWLATGPQPSAVLAVLRSAGQGLAAAHAAGIVHRDFKPSNVLVGADGRARVTDFGLARETSPDGLHDSRLVGTPAYMAPEQHARRAVDARSDQYSFCVTAWEALLGQRPFAGPSVAELGRLKAQAAPAAPTDSAVPHSIVVALQRGLDPVAARRWPDMATLLGALEAVHRRRRWWPALLIPACAGAIVVTPSTDPCTDVVETARDQWHDRDRPAVHTALATELGDERAVDVVAQLDARLDAWSSAHLQACTTIDAEGTGQDAAMRCLGRVRRDSATVVDAMLRRPAQALEALGGLDAPERCRLASSATRNPTPQSAAHEEIELAISQGWIARFEGRYDEALTRLTDGFAQARALGSDEQIALAGARLGHVQDLVDQPEAALQTLAIAAEAAAASHSDLTLAMIYVEQVWIESTLDRIDDALRTERAIEALFARIDAPPELEATRLVNLVALRKAQGQLERAEATLLRAKTIWEGAGEDTPRREIALAAIDHNLATITAVQGRYEHSLQWLLSERDRVAMRYGDDHETLASIWVDLAFAYDGVGRIDDAQAAALRGRSMASTHSGPCSEQVARAEHALAVVADGRDDMAGAIVHLEAAVAICLELGGERDLKAWNHQINIARMRLDLGDHDGAFALSQQAKAVLVDLSPPPMESVAAASSAALIAANTGHLVQARADLSTTLALLERVEAPGAAYYAVVRGEVADTYDLVGDHEQARVIRATLSVDPSSPDAI